MPLTNEQRAELDALGPDTVRAKLSVSGAGRRAAVAGFKTGILSAGILTRADIEDWLADKFGQEASERKRSANSIFWWTVVAAVASVIAAAASVAGLFR